MILLSWFIRFALMVICMLGGAILVATYLGERDARGFSSPLYIVGALVLFFFFIVLGAL